MENTLRWQALAGLACLLFCWILLVFPMGKALASGFPAGTASPLLQTNGGSISMDAASKAGTGFSSGIISVNLVETNDSVEAPAPENGGSAGACGVTDRTGCTNGAGGTNGACSVDDACSVDGAGGKGAASDMDNALVTGEAGETGNAADTGNLGNTSGTDDRGIVEQDDSGVPREESELVAYETMVVAKKSGLMLALYNTLTAPVSEESLRAMAQHCYGEVGGKYYDKVLMNWYLPGQSKGEKPWAVSNFTKGMEVVEILDEELGKQFPSAKRWQQPGHQPLVP